MADSNGDAARWQDQLYDLLRRILLKKWA